MIKAQRLRPGAAGPVLCRLDFPQVFGDGELRAQPSEHAGKGDDGQRIPRRREMETEARTIRLGEKAHLAVEEREPEPDDAKRKDTAGDTLEQTKVIERAPD